MSRLTDDLHALRDKICGEGLPRYGQIEDIIECLARNFPTPIYLVGFWKGEDSPIEVRQMPAYGIEDESVGKLVDYGAAVDICKQFQAGATVFLNGFRLVGAFMVEDEGEGRCVDFYSADSEFPTQVCE